MLALQVAKRWHDTLPAGCEASKPCREPLASTAGKRERRGQEWAGTGIVTRTSMMYDRCNALIPVRAAAADRFGNYWGPGGIGQEGRGLACRIQTHTACGPGSPELSKSYMDMASKLFTFTFTFTSAPGQKAHGMPEEPS